MQAVLKTYVEDKTGFQTGLCFRQGCVDDMIVFMTGLVINGIQRIPSLPVGGRLKEML